MDDANYDLTKLIMRKQAAKTSDRVKDPSNRRIAIAREKVDVAREHYEQLDAQLDQEAEALKALDPKPIRDEQARLERDLATRRQYVQNHERGYEQKFLAWEEEFMADPHHAELIQRLEQARAQHQALRQSCIDALPQVDPRYRELVTELDSLKR